MAYYIYEDKAENQVNIHYATCPSISMHGGDRSKPPYGGPYESPQEAENAALERGRRIVHYCQRYGPPGTDRRLW